MGQVERWHLPGNWAWAQFEDVAQIAQDLVAPSEVLDFPHIAPNHIGSGDRKLLPFSTVRADGVISAKQRFYPGQILFSKIRPYLLKSVLVEFEGVCSADMYPLWIRKNADPNYVLYWLTSPDFRDEIAMQQGRTVLPRINQPGLNASHIAVPPLAEQRRIVAKIDSLTGKSRRARDHLDHIPRLVEKYKQAVLAAAFRGQLVGLSTANTELPHDRCWDLPISWRWVRFSDVVEIASNLVKPEAIPNLPHIAPDNVEGGTGRLLPFRTINEDGVISAKHKFFAGQVIYSKIRPYLRKAVLVDFDGACSADMYPLSPSGDLDAAYLLYWLISEPFAGFTVEHEGRTVLPKINQQGLNQTPVPLPPLPDQLETVRRLRTAFNWIDRLASEATSACRLIDRLDQAVLAKAFRGELVPQDPEDEPASVLLDQIKAERGAAPTIRTRRKAT